MSATLTPRILVLPEQVECIFNELWHGARQLLDNSLRNQIRQSGGEQRAPVTAIVEIQHVGGP